MHLRILKRPTGTLDGICLDQFRVGDVYDIGTQVASVFLSEGWAELTTGENPTLLVRPQPLDHQRVETLVLVVDDEPAFLDLTSAVLSAHGYDVIVAVHGRDAMECIERRCPDLILLDLNMPVMNGWEFMAAQHELSDITRAAIPVVLLTGEEHATNHADTRRAAGVIKKPFDPEDLLYAVAVAMRTGGGSDVVSHTAR
jgi:CheY-like chemotaxis protein